MIRGICLLLAFACLVPAARAGEEIRFWHAMDGVLGEALAALAERFNDSQSGVRVVLEYQGGYEETLQAALTAQRAGKGPLLVQVDAADTAGMMAERRAVRPLWQVMAEGGERLDAHAFVPAIVSDFSDASGRLLALPFNISTPVLFYNKDAFRRAGLDPEKPPRLWYEMPAMLEALRASGLECPYTTAWPSWVQFETMSAWHNQEFATRDNGLAGLDARLAFNTHLMMRHVALLASWAESGYFSYWGRENEAEDKFARGECGVLSSSSASYARLAARAQFEFGIAQLPYYDDVKNAPQNTLIGGAGLWIMAGKTRAQYRGAARFLAYLAQSGVQAEWHQRTGYVPVTTAAYALSKREGFYEATPGQEVAILQLVAKAPARDSRGIRLGNLPQIRSIIDDELEAVFARRKTPKEALDAAVARGNVLLRRFELVHRANGAGSRTSATAIRYTQPRSGAKTGLTQ